MEVMLLDGSPVPLKEVSVHQEHTTGSVSQLAGVPVVKSASALAVATIPARVMGIEMNDEHDYVHFTAEEHMYRLGDVVVGDRNIDERWQELELVARSVRIRTRATESFK